MAYFLFLPNSYEMCNHFHGYPFTCLPLGRDDICDSFLCPLHHSFLRSSPVPLFLPCSMRGLTPPPHVQGLAHEPGPAKEPPASPDTVAVQGWVADEG